MTLWQQFDEQGRTMHGHHILNEEALKQGILHGAAHVWIWRKHHGTTEVLLQKRSDNMTTWPGAFDISAAGHIDPEEDALTSAVREVQEEVGVSIQPEDLKLIALLKARMVAPGNLTEHELQWLYLLEMPEGAEITRQESEVASLEWVELSAFQKDVSEQPDKYVPHGDLYFQLVVDAVKTASTRS